jgi:hypothetical protein
MFTRGLRMDLTNVVTFRPTAEVRLQIAFILGASAQI